MRFLVDENMGRAIVGWLRSQGHDVLFAAEAQPGATDTTWASLAEQESRVVITQDKDFGELTFRDGIASHGVILLRLDDASVAEVLARLQEVWAVVEANPSGRFIVVTESKVRVRALPSA